MYDICEILLHDLVVSTIVLSKLTLEPLGLCFSDSDTLRQHWIFFDLLIHLSACKGIINEHGIYGGMMGGRNRKVYKPMYRLGGEGSRDEECDRCNATS